jgi:hypothetical protein
MALWWLSFCDTARPKGTQFLGSAIVEAETIYHAVPAAWQHRCNPGGQVQLMELPDGLAKHVPPEWRHRLMTRQESEALDVQLTVAVRAEQRG